MDFGSSDCLYNDSDDLDTPNTELPPWAIGTAAVDEGVATTSVACRNASGSVTSGTTTGAPADDARYPALLRTPSVVYDLIGPDGAVYHNSNPSGNREWEQFRIDTEPFDPAMMDYHADRIPAGIWKVQLTGMDLSNLNAWRFFNDAMGLEICGVNPEDVCVPPLSPYLIGDYVWYDTNGNGEQDESDTGIPDVIVNLVDADGNVVESTTTSSDPLFLGQYIFEVDPGEWTVVVAPENFEDDGVLASFLPTVDYTGDDFGDCKRTQTLVDANILNYDFGYVQPVAELGDHVWLDSNGNGHQDAGEPGVEGVTVNLIGPGPDGKFGNADDDVLQTQQTDGAGNYLFTVSPGNYVVEFATGGLTTPNAGGDDELDSDADLGTGRSPVVTVGPNESNVTIDAGILPAQIGNTVWNDVDNDGFYEPAEGEHGIDGVVVQLNGDLNADGIVDYTSTRTTSSDCTYIFDNLFEGSYSVAIIESNFEFDKPLWGMSQSTDQSDSPDDGANRMNPWRVGLAGGENYTKADFGYWTMQVGGDGCTPGYWKQKQHFWAWEKYDQADDYDSIFGISGLGKTLLGALKAGGGGEKALGRHATAALLNASSSGVNYAFSKGQVIGMVQQAYATGNFEGIKNQLVRE